MKSEIIWFIAAKTQWKSKTRLYLPEAPLQNMLDCITGGLPGQGIFPTDICPSQLCGGYFPHLVFYKYSILWGCNNPLVRLLQTNWTFCVSFGTTEEENKSWLRNHLLVLTATAVLDTWIVLVTHCDIFSSEHVSLEPCHRSTSNCEHNTSGSHLLFCFSSSENLLHFL